MVFNIVHLGAIAVYGLALALELFGAKLVDNPVSSLSQGAWGQQGFIRAFPRGEWPGPIMNEIVSELRM